MSSRPAREGSTQRPPAVAQRRTEPLTTRRTVFESALGRVEDYHCSGGQRQRTHEVHSPEFQVGLPYRGVFVWHVGSAAITTDPNQVLFVPAGEDSHISEPAPGPYAELIVTPHLHLVSEILGSSPDRLSTHRLYQRRHALAGSSVLAWRARALHGARTGRWSGLAGDEALIALLRSTLVDHSIPTDLHAATRRLTDRARQYLAAHLSSTVRLTDIAAALGTSPAYLTDAFRRVEGLPLHRYLVRLRLGRAAIEVPRTNDLTGLAFDLGFSSHSHFTQTFRTAFGCTPSEFRARPFTTGVPDLP